MTSEPPEIKLEKSRIDGLVDIVGMGLLTYLLAAGHLTGTYERGAALGGILTIAGVATGLRAAGKGGSAILLTLGCAKHAVAGLAAYAVRHGHWFVLALTLTGCATFDEARAKVVDARQATNEMGAQLNAVGAALHAVCGPVPDPTTDCGEAFAAFNRVAQAYSVAQDAIDAAGAL